MTRRLPRDPSELTPERVRELLGDPSIERIEWSRIGADFGFESVVVRLDVTAPAPGRPYAVKFTTAEAARTEAHTHRVVLPSTGVRRPRLIAVADDGECGIVVTQLVEGEQGDVLAGCDRATALDLVGSIAGLHAAWWERAPPGVPALADRLRKPLTRAHVERCLAGHDDIVSAPTRRTFRSLPDRLDQLTERLLRLPATVVHGDLHLDNVLIGRDRSAMIVDWGRPMRAPAAVDLSRCFLEVVDAKPSDDLGRALVEHHCERLASLGIEASPQADVRASIELAHLVFAPGVIRWATSPELAPGTRQWRLLRNVLGRLDAQLS